MEAQKLPPTSLYRSKQRANPLAERSQSIKTQQKQPAARLMILHKSKARLISIG
jgi:hypothetical protein